MDVKGCIFTLKRHDSSGEDETISVMHHNADKIIWMENYENEKHESYWITRRETHHTMQSYSTHLV